LEGAKNEVSNEKENGFAGGGLFFGRRCCERGFAWRGAGERKS